MKIGICGLGLIGGSLAKAYKRAGESVYGYDIDRTVVDYAVMAHIIDSRLDEESISQCDYIFVALYPEAVTEYVSKIAPLVSKDAVVIDLCGTKGTVCPECFEIAQKYGFCYVGGHPMAGTQFSGLKSARENLFDGATMVLVPKPNEDMRVLARIKKTLVAAGFAAVTISTAKAHDEIIAYTSQLAHVVSNAYVKTNIPKLSKGFSAGSYRDMTRVACLNEKMWTQLFMANADNLAENIDIMISNLQQYSLALKQRDEQKLEELLLEGNMMKEAADSDGNN